MPHPSARPFWSQVQFPQYLEMHEYNNIQTRMLGADSFPYRDIVVDEQVRGVLLDLDFPTVPTIDILSCPVSMAVQV